MSPLKYSQNHRFTSFQRNNLSENELLRTYLRIRHQPDEAISLITNMI